MSTLAVATDVAGRMANDILEHQVNKISPVFRELNKNAEKCQGRTHRINISNGMQPGTGLVADGGSLPTASSIGMDTIDVAPAAFVSRISVGFIAAQLANGAGDGLNLWAENAEAAGKSLGFYIGRAIMDGYAFGLNDTVSGGSVTFTAPDVGGIRTGMVVSSSTGDEYTVSSVTRTPGSVSGSVTLTTSVADGAKNYELSIHGFSESNVDFVSLNDASGSGASDLYGETVSGVKWEGQRISAGGALTDNILLDLASRIEEEAASPVKMFIMNPATHREVLQGRSSSRRFVNPAGEDDLFGDYRANKELLGAQCVTDGQCPYTKAFAVSDEVKLGRWLSGDQDGFMDYLDAVGRGYDLSSSTLSQTSGKVALMQLIVRNRAGVGRVAGITHS